MGKYRFTGTHADTVHKVTKDEEINKNVPVAPGEFVDLTDKDLALDDNKWLIDDGLLQEVKDK